MTQVCYDINDYETKKRELASLVKVSKAIGCDRLTVLTWDYKAEEKYSGESVKV